MIDVSGKMTWCGEKPGMTQRRLCRPGSVPSPEQPGGLQARTGPKDGLTDPALQGSNGSWLQQRGLVRTLVLMGLREKILNNNKVKQKFLG